MSDISQLRRQWVATLAKLVRPADVAAAITAMSPMLALLADVPERAFDARSLEAVARKARGVPSYGIIRTALDERSAATAPAQLGAAVEHDEWRAKVERERAEAARDWSDPANVRRSVAGILALKCDRCGEQVPRDAAPDRCHCGGTLQRHPYEAMCGRMLVAIVRSHAPQNLGWLPVEWLRAAGITDPSERAA